MRVAWVALGLLAVCAAAPVPAQINKWVDENGRVHYGDRPPANKPSTTVQIQKSPPATVQNEASSVAPGKPSAEQPKAGAAGDSPIDRMKAEQAQKQRERLIAECKNNRGINCDSPEAVKQMLRDDTPQTAEQQRGQRNAPPSDFCARNPKTPGC